MRHASLRLRLLRRGAQDAAFNVISGHRPRLWADVDGRGVLALLRADGRQSCAAVLGGSVIWAATAAGCCAGCASGRSNCGRDGGGARVHFLQRAAAADRGRALRSLDEVDVRWPPTHRAARLRQSRPRHRGSQLTPPSSTGAWTGSPGTMSGGCYTGVCVVGLRQCTGVLLARLVSLRRRCAARSRPVWLLWPCRMERVCRIIR